MADGRIRKPASPIRVTRTCSRRQHDTAGREIAGRHREYLEAAYHRATEAPRRTRSAYRPGAQFAIVTPIEKTCCHSVLTRERIGRGRGANCRIVRCVRHRCMLSPVAHGLRTDHHYVPRHYVRAWTVDGDQLWTYPLLVPGERVRVWKLRLIAQIAKRVHLYTSVPVVRTPTNSNTGFLRRSNNPPLMRSIGSVPAGD